MEGNIKMDEFKFRAWHSVQKRMIDIYGLGPDFATENTLDGVDPGTNAFMGEDFKLLTVMQSTGLKDKNEVEIFKGDILKTASDKVMVVGWSVKFASFIIQREGWAFYHYFGEACNPEDVEVIGNIYQNTELLIP
jgi:uncharacterized phage protein (TIGR01671 family)